MNLISFSTNPKKLMIELYKVINQIKGVLESYLHK